MMSGASRKSAPRPAQPVGRYWKGKAPKGAVDLPSSDEDEDGEQEVLEEEGDEAVGGEQDFLSGAVVGDEEEEGGEGGKVKKMSIALKDVEIKNGKVVVGGKEDDENEESDEEEKDEKEGSEEEEEDTSSEEESESEEEKPKIQFRPVFVPKRARNTVAEREAEAQDTEEVLKRKEREAEERKKQSHDMVADSIRRELAEKEKEEEIPDVDDTDSLDPAAEFDAWRLRELARIKRDKEIELAREQEREEIERRRALPEEQRLKEDLEHAEKLRAEKPKGQQKFLQKYWHKGAFHQDEDILKKHDFTEATESTVDVSALPKVMQVRNFGKRSRTKYTHLLDQDTTASNGGFGGTGSVKSGGKGTEGGGCFNCGGPHLKKDCPQSTGLPSGRPGTGANATGRGFGDEKPGSWRDRDDGYSRRDGDRTRGYERRRSRSRSNERRQDDRRDSRPRGDRDLYESKRGWSARDRSRSRSPKRSHRPRADDRMRARDRDRSRSRSLSPYGREREGKRRRYD